jgi:hypothetical protein
MATRRAPSRGKGGASRKSRYVLQRDRAALRDFDWTASQFAATRDSLRRKIAGFYPGNTVLGDEPPDESANRWAGDLVDEALQVAGRVFWSDLSTPREELRIECISLLKFLKGAFHKLRDLSPELRGKLKAKAEIQDCCDSLEKLIPPVSAADNAIGKLPMAPKVHVVRSKAAVEIAITVLPYVKGMGISTAATETSVAVKILRTIGESIKLRLEPLTWKRIIIEAKKALKQSGRWQAAESKELL